MLQDPAAGIYKKLVISDNRIKGAVLYGDTIDGTWYFQLMREGTDIADFRKTMLFGQHDLGDAGHGDETRVMSLPDEAEICGCNGVCKGDIVKAISKQGLFTLEDVRAHTKASSSCGSCTGLVEALLASTVGEGYDASPNKKPMCKCTEYSHDEVIAAIKQQRTEDHAGGAQFPGVEDTRTAAPPAARHSTTTCWPTGRANTRTMRSRASSTSARTATSRRTAPTRWCRACSAGWCKPDELRAIADVCDKYEVPEVKVTGGQRIDMFGVKKEDLPLMWKDLSDGRLCLRSCLRQGACAR